MNSDPAPYQDQFWTSRDDVKLHYRDYAGRMDRPAILCIPGLTRNARDFEQLAQHLAGEWRVLCLDLRGRGESGYAKDSASYVPLQYLDDINMLLEHAGIKQFISIGTSLGALLTMTMASSMPDRLVGAVLNDAGPVLNPEGLKRIAGYVGQGRSFPTWMHAARAIQETHQSAFPDFTVDDWLQFSKQVMTIASNGRIVFDYDMKIAEPFSTFDNQAVPDMWPGLEALSGKPLVIVHGKLSDLLSAETAAEMQKRAKGSELVSLPRVGHPPTLNEPNVVAAIDRMLAKIG